MPNVLIDANDALTGFAMEEGTLSALGLNPKINADDIPKLKKDEGKEDEKGAAG